MSLCVCVFVCFCVPVCVCVCLCKFVCVCERVKSPTTIESTPAGPGGLLIGLTGKPTGPKV